MATTKRESPLGLGKDKKPTRSLARISTTPSSIPTLGRRSAPSTPSTSNVKPRSSSNKNVRKKPSLASTSPSSPTSRVAKKHDTCLKAPLYRRRSFDKPPSISNVKPAPLVTKKPAPLVTKKPALSRRTSMDSNRQSKGSVKPMRAVVRRSMTPPPSPKKPMVKASTPPLASTPTSPLRKKSSVPPFVEDRYTFPDEVEEIANIGSDDDLVPFDQMEFPEMNANAYDSGNVVNNDDPAVAIPEETKDDDKLVEEEVKASQQDEESNNSSSGDFEIVEEGKVSAARPRPKWKQQPVVKKESGVSNGVIEETASKLLEKRKNKVRALVGAFETVISLQD